MHYEQKCVRLPLWKIIVEEKQKNSIALPQFAYCKRAAAAGLTHEIPSATSSVAKATELITRTRKCDAKTYLHVSPPCAPSKRNVLLPPPSPPPPEI